MNLQTIKDTSGNDEYVLVPMHLFELLRADVEKKLEDPVLRSLIEAPYDDEGETEEEQHLVEEGREAMRQGQVVSHEDVGKRFQKKRKAS